MDIKNIKQLDEQKYEIRFSYIDKLTGRRRRIRRRMDGTLTEAIEFRDRLKARARNGQLNRPQGQQERSLDDWVDEYVSHKESKGLRASSVDEIKSALNRVLAGAVGDWRPEVVEAHHLDRWVAKQLRSTELSPATVSKRLGYLKRLIKYACKRLGRPVGFLRDVDPVKGSTRRKGRALTPQEAKRFLRVMKQRFPQHYALCFVLLATGQRFGAVTALRWSDVDDEWITFNRSQYRGEVEYGSKSGNVIRIPITDQIGDVLDWHRRWMLKTQHPNIDHPGGLIFPTMKPHGESSTGGYRMAGALRGPFRKVCKTIEIDRITPHDLRRTFNTWAAERVSGVVLRSMTGHSSSSMTDHYYHGSREAKGKVVEAIGKLVEKA